MPHPTDLWYDPTIDLDKLTPAEHRQLSRLMRRLGMSVWETLALMRERLLFLTDPAPGTGERFTAKEFDRRDDFVDEHYFDKAKVPAPNANVDIVTAMFWAERDTHNFATLLEDRRSLPVETLLAGIENTHAWHRFLARRDPDPVGRRRSAVIAAECERMLNRLRLKAEAIEAKRTAKPYDAADYFASEADLPEWPESSTLLGTAGSKEGLAIRKQRYDTEARERRRAIREVPKPSDSAPESPKPKGSRPQ
jgi:hypothetical protein